MEDFGLASKALNFMASKALVLASSSSLVKLAHAGSGSGLLRSLNIGTTRFPRDLSFEVNVKAFLQVLRTQLLPTVLYILMFAANSAYYIEGHQY